MPCKTKCIDAGLLRHKIKVQRPTTQVDSYGQTVEGPPTTVISPWAEILDARGGETLRGEQVDATASHLVRIRFTAKQILATDYVEWESRRLNVVHVADPDGTRRELRIHCKEQK